MSHLRRAVGVLIAVLLVVFVVPFVVPRVLPTTSYIEPYGFYPKNSEGNAREWASRPMQYVDAAGCNSCHNDKYDAWTKSAHSSVSCENCHGPGAAHVEKGTTLVVDRAREACGVCHSQVVARPASFPQVNLKQHGGQAACVTCHNPHDPKIAAQPAAIPHSLEGRADCLLCHNTGALKPFPKDHGGRTSGTCLSCHRSK